MLWNTNNTRFNMQRKHATLSKSYMVYILCAALIIQLISVSFLTNNHVYADGTSRMVSEEPITSGAILKKYEWNTTRSGKAVKVSANVVEVDLQNPLVKLDVMNGVKGKFTTKQTVRGMANETGAVAGVNGDFYNTQTLGAPMGGQITNGKLIATPQILPGFYSFALTKDNKPVIDLFTFRGEVKTKSGASFNLGGVNRNYYWYEPSGQHSMIDNIFLFTSEWDNEDRGNDGVTEPTEVLVRNGIIIDIKKNGIFNMAPPADGYILRSSGTGAQFVLDHMKIGEPLTSTYEIIPQDPGKTYDTKNFKTLIGGQTILVDQGQPTEFSRKDADYKSFRSRTGVGYSKDERYAYLVTIENAGDSKGMNFEEFQQFMISMGIWKGMNLDGGGSTTMVTRPLGETAVKVTGETEYGSNYERQVVNGLGVYSLAPRGQAKSITIQGQTQMLLNEKITYQIKGYDEYYNPFVFDPAGTKWSATHDSGTFNGNTFTPLARGTTVITATYGTATQSLEVNVVGKQDIVSMNIVASNTVIEANADIKLSVKVKFKNGAERVISGSSFTWETRGFKGTVQGDVLHIDSVENSASGQLIASYDNFSTIQAMTTGTRKMWADFDQTNVPFSFSSYPAEVKGGASVVTGLQGLTGKGINLQYDMKLGTGTKAAYAVFGDTGVAVEGNPQSLSVKVLGDNNLNWLRAEIVDANGKTTVVDLARTINWSGWRTVTADLGAANLAYPIKLKRIYIANITEGQDERAAAGSIVLDDISFQYRNQPVEKPKNQIKLTIDKPEININGQSVTIDQAPYIVAGNTMVPIRFVTEALGGEVAWEDAGERKVTILRGSQLAIFWLGQLDTVMNGQRITAEVSPELKNERTMVPLRVLSENLGWKVTWDEATRTVTLE